VYIEPAADDHREKSNQSYGSPRRPAPWISETFQEITHPLADDLARIKGDDLVELIDQRFKGTLKDRLGYKDY
jgi:hypothetical protein